MVCRGGEWQDTGRNCDWQAIADIPHVATFDGPESDDQHLPNAEAREYTHYSRKQDLRWVGDKLYGRYAQQLADVCRGAAMSAYINKIQIIEIRSVGTCQGHEIISVRINA